MLWTETGRCDPAAAALADRHYSRIQHGSVGSANFVAPGSCQVLKIINGRRVTALWVTRLIRFTRHRWPNHLECSLFRNEGAGLSSALITQAVAAGRWKYGALPWLTFVDAGAVKRKRDPGRCYLRAGFRRDGTTKVHKLLAFVLPVSDLPPPQPPLGATLNLFT